MKVEISGRMVRWSIELNEFDLKYMPRIVIKAQALADIFIKQIEDEQKAKHKDLPELAVYVDGSSNSKGNDV